MGFEVEGTIPMEVCETQPGRPGVPLCFSVKLYVCLLFCIEYFFSFLYRRYPPLLAILGRVPVIRYGGQESAGGGDRCHSVVENGYLLSRVSLPLEATSPHQSSKLRLTCGLHPVAHVCARVHFYEAFPWIER